MAQGTHVGDEDLMTFGLWQRAWKADSARGAPLMQGLLTLAYTYGQLACDGTLPAS